LHLAGTRAQGTRQGGGRGLLQAPSLVGMWRDGDVEIYDGNAFVCVCVRLRVRVHARGTLPADWGQFKIAITLKPSPGTMELRTWGDVNSKAAEGDADALLLYWPFGFPRDYLIYSRYFANSLMRKQFPWRRLPIPSASIFDSCAPLYTAVFAEEPSKETFHEEIAKELFQPQNDDLCSFTPQKRVFLPTRLVAARNTVLQLFEDQPPTKRAKAECKRSSIELYPQIKCNIGSIGMTMCIIRSLVSDSGFKGRSMRSCCRDGDRIIAHIFGCRRHEVIFPYFKGFSSSIPRQSSLSLAIQVIHLKHCEKKTSH
jgi:hypothetical protein